MPSLKLAPIRGERLRAVDRRPKAWDLRIKGGSIRAIGKELGVSPKTIERDLAATAAELNQRGRDGAERHRAESLDTLRMLLSTVVDILTAGVVDTQGILRAVEKACGAIGEGEGGEALDQLTTIREKVSGVASPETALKAAQRAESLVLSRAGLLGLTKPEPPPPVQVGIQVAVAQLGEISDEDLLEVTRGGKLPDRGLPRG